MPGVAQPSSDLRHSLKQMDNAISAKSKMETPVIKPPKGRQYKVKQSRYKALADVNPAGASCWAVLEPEKTCG